MINMKVKTGYIYHIKDTFFEIVKDENLMQNHELGKKRPTYFTIKDNDILQFIPLSSKVSKYKKIINNKIKKYGKCNTILIRKVLGNDTAILLQNAFPTLEKYIDHVHILENGKPAKVIEATEKEILENFNLLLKLKSKGKNFFFTNIDYIKELMIKESNNQ